MHSQWSIFLRQATWVNISTFRTLLGKHFDTPAECNSIAAQEHCLSTWASYVHNATGKHTITMDHAPMQTPCAPDFLWAPCSCWAKALGRNINNIRRKSLDTINLSPTYHLFQDITGLRLSRLHEHVPFYPSQSLRTSILHLTHELMAPPMQHNTLNISISTTLWFWW